MTAVKVVVFLAGLALVVATMGSAIRTVILPRAVPARIARWVFRAMRALFRLRAGRDATYEKADHLMAFYAPVSLLALLVTWLGLVFVAFIGLFWATGEPPGEAVVASGSSLLTLGFERPPTAPGVALSFVEATLGLILIALLIAYLPSIYAVFSRREAMVALMEVRAGSPPDPVEMLARFWVIGFIDRLPELFRDWERWFVEVDESHTSFPSLPFFRSPHPEHSWVTAAGTVLDAASLSASTLDRPGNPDQELCIRAGYVALRHIADFYTIPYRADPGPDDPISVTRHEFDAAYDRLAARGLPLKPDRDKAWQDFAGWRVNYDEVLVGLAALTMAPPAPWSTDRIPLMGDRLPVPRWQQRRSLARPRSGPNQRR